MQSFTSANTSINSKKLPAVYRKAAITSDIVMDYGCGRYTELIRSALPAGIRYLPYDPYNQSGKVNAETMQAIDQAITAGAPVDVVCSNVLNVIDSDDEIRRIARRIESIIYATRGKAFITVYEGNRSGNGRQSGPDQYQRNEPLKAYARFFRKPEIRNGMLIIRGDR